MPVVKGYEVDITHENPAIPIDVIEDVVARLSHPETVMVENRADIFDSHLRVTCRVIALDNLRLYAVAVVARRVFRLVRIAYGHLVGEERLLDHGRGADVQGDNQLAAVALDLGDLALHQVGTHGIRTRGALTADEGNGQEEEAARLEELLLGQGV